jgi:hypothetical protein
VEWPGSNGGCGVDEVDAECAFEVMQRKLGLKEEIRAGERNNSWGSRRK